MALNATVVTVGTSAVALNSAGPTHITIYNFGFDQIRVGHSGAGNQIFPISGGGQLTLDIVNTDVVYGIANSAGQKVGVITA